MEVCVGWGVRLTIVMNDLALYYYLELCTKTMGNCKGWNLPERLRLYMDAIQ